MKNRRTNRKIKREFQNQVIFNVVVASFCLLNLVLIWLFAAIDTLQDLSSFKTWVVLALATGEIGGLFIVYRFIMRETHRMAGPVYKLEQGLEDLAAGNLTASIELRGNDYFRETSDIFNHCARELRSKFDQISHSVGALKSELERDGIVSENLAVHLQQLVTAIDDLQLHASAQNTGPHADEGAAVTQHSSV